MKMNKQNKCNYRMHAIIIKRLYKKLSLMECLNGPILKRCLSDLSDIR